MRRGRGEGVYSAPYALLRHGLDGWMEFEMSVTLSLLISDRVRNPTCVALLFRIQPFIRVGFVYDPIIGRYMDHNVCL